jgi:drug/metabolite transporter (DMT)-like permease
MPSIPLGELASLGTALCWSGSATFFSQASRRLGAVVLNRVRLLFAAAFLLLTHRVLLGSFFPAGVGAERYAWLCLSGVIGLAIGDALLFQAYVLIGARLGMLLMSFAPVLSAWLALMFLDEHLTAVQWSGIVLAVAGIAWVVAEGDNLRESTSDHRYGVGILFGLGAAVCQATGLALAKRGLTGDFSALSGVVIRIVSALVVLWLVTVVQGQAVSTFRRIADNRTSLLPAAAGSVAGPTLGVWLSLVAIQLAPIGVASTIMALPPVFLLPIGKVVFHERISRRAVGGTLVALAGVALLFLVR